MRHMRLKIYPAILPLMHGLSARRRPMFLHFLTRWVSMLLRLTLVSWAFVRVGFRLSIAFPFCLPYLGVFPFTLLHLPLNFIRVPSSRLRYMCLHPSVDPPFTLFRWVFRLGTGSGTRCCGPSCEAGVRMKQKSRFKCQPWPGFEPRTLQSDGRERYH